MTRPRQPRDESIRTRGRLIASVTSWSLGHGGLVLGGIQQELSQQRYLCSWAQPAPKPGGRGCCLSCPISSSLAVGATSPLSWGHLPPSPCLKGAACRCVCRGHGAPSPRLPVPPAAAVAVAGVRGVGCSPPPTPAPSRPRPAPTTRGGWVSDTDTGRAARSFGSEKHTCGSPLPLASGAPRAVPRIKPNGPRSSPAGAGPTRSGRATDVQFNFLKHQGWAFLRGPVAPCPQPRSVSGLWRGHSSSRVLRAAPPAWPRPALLPSRRQVMQT